MEKVDITALVEKWAPILEHAELPKITDRQRLADTAILLENQEKANREAAGATALNEAAPVNSVGAYPDSNGVAKWDSVLINLVRRSAPAMIAYDVCGVQTMTMPTGLVFAFKSRYTAQNGTEALYNEADTDFSGTGTHAGDPGVSGSTTGTGMTVSAGEGKIPAGMAFSIEKTSVEAKTRALQAEYSVELQQDMKAVHGLDADAELSNILSTEIVAETNREILRTIYASSAAGAQIGTATQGIFDLDVDANGRWSVEKFAGLGFQVEREANQLLFSTRRGKGNIIIASADVVSALAMTGQLDYTKADLSAPEGSTFAGVWRGKYKVYVDPYASNASNDQLMVIGYKGSSRMDAGVFYCPYVGAQMFRTVDPTTYQPKVAMKTRYGLIANPFSSLSTNSSIYYRRLNVRNLL